MTRPNLVLPLAIFLLFIGCGNADGEQPGIISVVTGLIQTDDAPAPDAATLRATLTPAALAAVTTKLALIELPARDAAVVVSLVQSNNSVDTYLSADNVSLSINDGMLVATRGLGFDLMTADTDEARAAIRAEAQTAVRIHRYLDGENQTIVRVFQCSFIATSVLQVTEYCQSPDLRFENRYNLNADGAIVASRQWVSPQIGYLGIEALN